MHWCWGSNMQHSHLCHYLACDRARVGPPAHVVLGIRRLQANKAIHGRHGQDMATAQDYQRISQQSSVIIPSQWFLHALIDIVSLRQHAVSHNIPLGQTATQARGKTSAAL